MNIFTNIPFSKQQKEKFLRVCECDHCWFAHPEKLNEEDFNEFNESQVAFGSVDPQWVSGSDHLRWLQLNSVGVDQYRKLNWDKLSSKIVCTNLRGFFSLPVSETILAGVMAIYRGIDQCVRYKEAKEWKKLEIRPSLRLLKDSSVCIIGLGSIGQCLKKLFEPLVFKVITYDKFNSNADMNDLSELDDALGGFDVVSLTLPGTDETRGFFNKDRIAKLSTRAVLCNAGRGTAIDEQSLIKNLVEGRIAGAVLDTTTAEPVQETSPLWDCPNLILTQHTAGGTVDELDRLIDFFAENFKLYKSTKKLNNVVDWRRDY